MKDNSVRIAYCVVCHKYTPVLKALVEWLGDGNDFYIHVDAKADIAPFGPLRGVPNVFFVDDRITIWWGDRSLSYAELSLFRATVGRCYDYIALISGDTLPLHGNERISRILLSKGLDTEYLPEDLSGARVEKLVKYRYPSHNGMRKRTLPGRALQKLRSQPLLMRRNTLFGKLPPLSKGSNWIMITPACRDYLLDRIDRDPWYMESFRFAYVPEEIFIHTLIRDSPFRDRIADVRTMYTDWRTGPAYPRTLDESDFERLLAAKELDDGKHCFLFARKIGDGMDLVRYRAEVLASARVAYAAQQGKGRSVSDPE